MKRKYVTVVSSLLILTGCSSNNGLDDTPLVVVET